MRLVQVAEIGWEGGGGCNPNFGLKIVFFRCIPIY